MSFVYHGSSVAGLEIIKKQKGTHQKEKRLIIYDYPTRPDYIPLDNSDLIETARKFEAMGITGAEEHLYELYPQLRNVRK